jgi:hypothetical protein
MAGITLKAKRSLGRVPRNAKENIVHLFLVNKLNQLKVDAQTFFRIAHVWAFGTDPDLSNDVAQYQLHAVIPRYVISYLKSLQ